MKYVIFSDVDGTLYDKSYTVHPDTFKDVKAAQDKGIEFIIATGNPYFENMKKLGNQFNSSYIITSNGAGIINLKTNEYIFKQKIAKDEAQKMLDKALELNLGADWWDEEKLFFNTKVIPEIVNFWKKHEDFNVTVMDQIKQSAFKFECYDKEGQSYKIDEMIKFLKQFDVQVAHMKPHHIEVTANNVSKGHAIKWLTNHLGISLDNTMGVGDSANDKTMFETVEHSYAMANAPENIKALTKYETDHVKENGAGKAIQDFMKKNNL